MADPYGNSPSKYHLLFGRKPSDSNNIAVLTSIKSIWGDDQIEKLEDNQWLLPEHPWSYTKYSIQQLLMTYPVSVICKRSFLEIIV